MTAAEPDHMAPRDGVVRRGDGRRFQILSLDGGGLKGLFSAAVLAELENDLRVAIADSFDLIVGTSTGGLIALGLGAGLRPADCRLLRRPRPPDLRRRAQSRAEPMEGEVFGDPASTGA